jgi:AcrR family transcriptional regulator
MRRSLPEEDVLNRLETIFLHDGYRDVTVADLTRALGCSRRRLYEFAPTKDGLFLFVMGRFFEKVRQEGRRRADSEPDHGDRIRGFLSAAIEEARRMSDLCVADFQATLEGKTLYERHLTLRVSDLKGILQAGADAGVFRPVNPHLIAETLLFAVMRAREPSFQQEAGITFADALNDLSLVMREGFRTDGPPSPEREKTLNRTLNLLVRSNVDMPAR